MLRASLRRSVYSFVPFLALALISYSFDELLDPIHQIRTTRTVKPIATTEYIRRRLSCFADCEFIFYSRPERAGRLLPRSAASAARPFTSVKSLIRYGDQFIHFNGVRRKRRGAPTDIRLASQLFSQ